MFLFLQRQRPLSISGQCAISSYHIFGIGVGITGLLPTEIIGIFFLSGPGPRSGSPSFINCNDSSICAVNLRSERRFFTGKI